LLGLDFSAGLDHCRFEMTPSVARHDGTLYGGTAIAVSVVAMEAATARPALWVTTQYVATARLGEVVECTAEVLANGRNISQVQVTGRLGAQTVFVSLGSTATPREGGVEGQWQSMPRMTPPEESKTMVFGPPGGFRGFMSQVEYREAYPKEADGSEPPLALWARLTGGGLYTPASMSFVADMVPGAIARSVGKVGGGTSLDNSLRFGHISGEEEWVLLDLRAHMAAGAHAHGSVFVWTRQGELVAVGGQSANMSHMVSLEELEAAGAGGD
jgi:acyl-CoA thioesterase